MLRSSSFFLFGARYEPASSLPMHSHKVGRITLVLRGLYQETDEAGTYDCRPRTLWFFPPGLPHSNQFPTAAECLHLGIDSPLLRRVSAPRAPLSLRSPQALMLGAQLRREFLRPDRHAAVALEGLALQLLAVTLRAAQAGPAIPGWLQGARDLVNERFAGPLTTAGVAGTVGISPSQLNRAFRRYYRVSLGAYVRWRRIERARRLLEETALPLAVIAHQCGFFDQSHFTGSFRQLVGLSPGRYRAGRPAQLRPDHPMP